MSPGKETNSQLLNRAYEVLLKNEHLLSLSGMNMGRSKLGWVNEFSLHGLKLLVQKSRLNEEKRKELLLKVAITLEIGILISREGGSLGWENSLVMPPIVEALEIIESLVSEEEVKRRLESLRGKESYNNFLSVFHYELEELKQEGVLRFFYGGSIQGGRQKCGFGGEIIDFLKDFGVKVVSEHVRGRDRGETRKILAEELGIKETDLTPEIIFNASRDWCLGDIDGAVLEMSVPSLGTGMELMMLLGRKDVPILCLYEKGSHEGRLSSMVTGAQESFSQMKVVEYINLIDARFVVEKFVLSIREGNCATPEGSPNIGKERE